MRILRKKKLKKHINKIVYISVFSIASLVITIGAMSGKDKVEYMEFPETETYIVDVESRAVEKVATVIQQETTQAAEVEDTKANTNSSYKGIFMMNTTGNLNVRGKADASSEIVGILTEGAGGDVLKYGAEWTKIKSGNVTGYVATDYIVIGEQAESMLKKKGYTATVTTDILKVRSEKNTQSTVLGIAVNGAQYKCSKVYSDWAKIKFEGKTGYVSKEFVKIEQAMIYAKTVEEIEAEQAAQEAETEVQETEAATQPQQPETTVYTAPEQPSTEPPTTKRENPVTNVSYDDAYLLACLVACEAGNQPYEGKLAVANVVLNRVASSIFPNSIKGVIYQSGQFGPAWNSSLDAMLKSGPDAGSQQAANAALSGTNNVPGYLFFGPVSGINVNNLSSYTIIGNHVFY